MRVSFARNGADCLDGALVSFGSEDDFSAFAMIRAACQAATKFDVRPTSIISRLDSGFSQNPPGSVRSSGIEKALLTSRSSRPSSRFTRANKDAI